MKLWPFGRTEKRAKTQGGGSQGGAGFTDAIVGALLAQAAGGTTADASATAALEAAAGSYARAFAVASVEPDTPATRALTPELLALMARDLIRRGEFVHVIEVGREGVRLLPAGSWDVRGRPDPDTWHYRCDTFGPSGNVTRNLPGAAVIHGRYSVDPARPWWGVSPLGWARLTGKLHANLEDAIADEAGGTRGHILPVPQGPATDDDTDPLADLRADIASLRGKTVLAETVAAAWGEGTLAAPVADWRPQRIGANPPPSLATLRTDSAQAVLSACGCSADLFVAGDAAGQRESWRRFLHGSVQPLGDLLAAELAVKLDVPGLRLTFDRLFASDLSGRARAFGSLVQGGMDADRAATLAGLS